jgi:hypothetical protein
MFTWKKKRKYSLPSLHCNYLESVAVSGKREAVKFCFVLRRRCKVDNGSCEKRRVIMPHVNDAPSMRSCNFLEAVPS